MMIKRWREKPWKHDLTYTHEGAVIVIAAITLVIFHLGFIAPLAEGMMRP